MADTTSTKSKTAKSGSKGKSAEASENTAEAKAKFAQALEDAKAGAQALGKEAQQRAEEYREKASSASKEWQETAKARGDQAMNQATDLARQGKSKASEAIASLGKIVAENAPLIDEKLGSKYGDYARSSARSMEETATKLETKDFDELGEDAREFVRKSPGLAVGMAAAAGFLVARLFRGSKG